MDFCVKDISHFVARTIRVLKKKDINIYGFFSFFFLEKLYFICCEGKNIIFLEKGNCQLLR